MGGNKKYFIILDYYSSKGWFSWFGLRPGIVEWVLVWRRWEPDRRWDLDLHQLCFFKWKTFFSLLLFLVWSVTSTTLLPGVGSRSMHRSNPQFFSFASVNFPHRVSEGLTSICLVFSLRRWVDVPGAGSLTWGVALWNWDDEGWCFLTPILSFFMLHIGVVGFLLWRCQFFSLHVTGGCWPAVFVCWGVLVLDYLWFTVIADCWSHIDLGSSLLVHVFCLIRLPLLSTSCCLWSSQFS